MSAARVGEHRVDFLSLAGEARAAEGAGLSWVAPSSTPRVHSPPSVSVVVPTLNEAENLPFVLPRIPRGYEVILVDGCSTDSTVVVAREVRPEVVVVEESRAGKGAALRAGFVAATGDVIVTIDADGSTDPAEIPLFVDALVARSEEHTSELQSRQYLVCRLLLEKKKKKKQKTKKKKKKKKKTKKKQKRKKKYI